MKVFPSIDIFDGKVAKLKQGRIETVKFYKEFSSPIEAAKKWESLGADALHIIDINAAFNIGNNRKCIHEIIKSINIPIQVGGGIRSIKDIESLLNIGVKRVIIGSLAFSSNKIVKEILKEFDEESLVIAMDHVNGIIMIDGWRSSTGMRIEEAIKKFKEDGFRLFLVTSILKDGLISGTDIDILRKICNIKGIEIFAAGGIATMNDIIFLKNIGISAIVIGSALYEGFLNISDVIKLVRE